MKPLPAPLLSTLGLKQFWTDYLFVSESGDKYPALNELQLRFDVSPEYGLTLDLDDELSLATLFLRHPDAEQLVQIAWDDQAGWHPHILRWAELDGVCCNVTRRAPYLQCPFLPLLLLYRFAPVTNGDDADTIFQMLEAAWRSLNLFPEDEIRRLARMFDYRCAGFIWKQDAQQNWTIHQDESLRQKTGDLAAADLYTLRLPCNIEFPFSQMDALAEVASRGVLAGPG